jgi:phosphate transport system ATP-binding protein
MDAPLVQTSVYAAHAETDSSSLREKVSIRKLNFYYGDGHALKDINLALYANQTTAFIGPSGCGKSTLLRVLNRMYDLYPNQRAVGQLSFKSHDILSPKEDVNLLRATRTHRHGVSEAHRRFR